MASEKYNNVRQTVTGTESIWCISHYISVGGSIGFVNDNILPASDSMLKFILQYCLKKGNFPLMFCKIKKNRNKKCKALSGITMGLFAV